MPSWVRRSNKEVPDEHMGDKPDKLLPLSRPLQYHHGTPGIHRRLDRNGEHVVVDPGACLFRVCLGDHGEWVSRLNVPIHIDSCWASRTPLGGEWSCSFFHNIA
jgi:hypothetical protein